jgi:hypothetical protein
MTKTLNELGYKIQWSSSIGLAFDDSIFDLWRHLLTETTSGLFLELLFRLAYGVAKVALGAQNTSYATNKAEK